MQMEMKSKVIMSMLALGLIAGTNAAIAETITPDTGQQHMHGNMMRSGMMDDSMIDKNGMMRGKGPGMMGNQGNWSMGCDGMMGEMMMNRMSHGQQQEFLDQTTDLRRQMMKKRFKYMEAMRNSDGSPQDLAKIEKEMLELRSKMMNQMSTIQKR